MKDERLYMTFPNDMHRHPKIRKLSVEGRWAFVEMVAERAGSSTAAVPCTWPDHVVVELHTAGMIRFEGDGIALVENGMWAVVRPYRKAIDPAVRAAIYERDMYRCCACGSGDDLQIDHIYPWSLGGTDEPNNLQTLCAPCNQSKGAKVDALVQG